MKDIIKLLDEMLSETFDSPTSPLHKGKQYKEYAAEIKRLLLLKTYEGIEDDTNMAIIRVCGNLYNLRDFASRPDYSVDVMRKSLQEYAKELQRIAHSFIDLP